jgi:hypothetical protein
MGESNMHGKVFDGTECAMASSKSASLVGDEMVCKSFNDIFRKPKQSDEACFLPSNAALLEQLSDAQSGKPGVCEAPKHEKRGPVDVTSDEYGEMIAVKDSRGNTFTKRSDGKWVEHGDYGDTTVENLTVDSKGNLSYDYNGKDTHTHNQWNADGSYSFDSKDQGKLVYDKDNNVVEAPAGDGHSRKFHYTNGQLDQIDGRLGHWDRVVKDGQVSWVNKGTKAVWEGDFRVNAGSDALEFRGHNGAAWEFTTTGRDLRLPAKKP